MPYASQILKFHPTNQIYTVTIYSICHKINIMNSGTKIKSRQKTDRNRNIAGRLAGNNRQKSRQDLTPACL
jgi:hypothetical protein